MRYKPTSLLILFFAGVLLSACSVELSSAKPTDAPTPLTIITATLPPTFTPQPSATPIPPSPTPTVPPIGGRTTAQVNVRRAPDTASETLGTLPSGASVQILGEDESETWYQIRYEAGKDGKAWVSAAYVLATEGADIPVIQSEEASGAVLTQTVNVRAGPGTAYDTLGLLPVGSRVSPIGKNANSTWLQIKYEDSPEGNGWVAAGYVKSAEIESLPVTSEEEGTPIAEDNATAPPSPTPTFAPAPLDEDSAEAPALSVQFSAREARAFTYTSDLSSPTGDSEDWVAFTVQNPDSARATLYVSLQCEGNGKLVVELWQGGVQLDNWGTLQCGDEDNKLTLYRNETYEFRIRIKKASTLEYIRYALTLRVR